MKKKKLKALNLTIKWIKIQLNLSKKNLH